MRLHRLTLTNYRGITHREIEFAERGVTVVCGANEIGKSSMIEALDLLLESKDRSNKKDVKQVKPTHADVGAEVTAEISTGPYRFVYRKRFHKKCETELSILAPAREQLTGDEAHQRVRGMLDETVDAGLWQAQRVLQAASTSAVDLSACDALSRALDVAASDAADGLSAGLSGAEPVLIEKIDAEYARYFTATGRPTGEWAAAIAAMKTAEAEVAARAAEVAEVDERVRAHAAMSEQLEALVGQRSAAAARLVTAAAAAEELAALTAEVRTAESEAAAKTATANAAAAALEERRRVRSEVQSRQEALDAAQVAAVEAQESEDTGREVVVEAEAAAAAAEKELHAVDERVRAASKVVAQLAERAEADRLTALVSRVDAALAERAEVDAALAPIVLSDKMFRDIEAAAAAADLAQAQAELTATAVEFTAEADVELTVGEDRVTLTAGQTWSLSAAEHAAVSLPGLLRIDVKPAATAVDTHAKLAAAQHHLAKLLSGAGVADLDEARRVQQRRIELTGRRGHLDATLSGITGDDDIADLRARLEALRPGADLGIDAEAAHAERSAAEQALQEATTHAQTQRRVAAAALKQLAERTTSATVSRDRAVAAQTELATSTARLAALQAAQPDEDAVAQVAAATAAAEAARARVAELTARLAEAGPDAVTAELAAARTAADTVNQQHNDTARALRDIEVELSVFGTEGRTGQLDAAQITREHAVAAYARVQRRARAVELLRTVMVRHRDNIRLRYVQPFRTEVERLGRTVFGETFEVEVDSDLCIRNRTLDGRTVPFESLSGGAKEQLGIVARLAVAALVANEDTVPVVIDDALGFSDPERLARMGAVFDQVGADGQVIVLTCSPERYNSVSGAHRVQLSA